MNFYGWVIIIGVVSFIWALWSYRREVAKSEHIKANEHIAKEKIIYQSSSSE